VWAGIRVVFNFSIFTFTPLHDLIEIPPNQKLRANIARMFRPDYRMNTDQGPRNISVNPVIPTEPPRHPDRSGGIWLQAQTMSTPNPDVWTKSTLSGVEWARHDYAALSPQ